MGPATGGPTAPGAGLGFTVLLRKIPKLQKVGVITHGQLERDRHRGGGVVKSHHSCGGVSGVEIRVPAGTAAWDSTI